MQYFWWAAGEIDHSWERMVNQRTESDHADLWNGFPHAGGQALQFLSEPVFDLEVLGQNFVVNCTVDDPSASVSLWGNTDLPGAPWIEILPSPGNVVRKGQVFLVSSTGQGLMEKYRCKATNGNETIKWPEDMGYVPYIPTIGKKSNIWIQTNSILA